MTNGFGKCLLFVFWANERSKHGLFVFPPKKTLIWRRHCLPWPIVLQYDVKAKFRLNTRRFSGWLFFFSSERSLNQPKATHICIYIRSVVISALFARFHFKIIRKLFYLVGFCCYYFCCCFFFYARVRIDKVEGMQKRTLFWPCSL